MDGLLTIQGPWAARRYGGFVSARDVRLGTSSGTFPLSEIALRIDSGGVRLAPVRLTLAPRVELTAEGTLYRPGPGLPGRHGTGAPPRYELVLSAKAVPLRDLARFGRGVDARAFRGLDAEGLGTVTLRLAGSAWPFERPALSGRAELRAARLIIPGLTESLNIPRASIQVNGNQIIADPVMAVIGTSVFTGRLEHQGDRKKPWKFDVWGNNLSLEEGALWFDVLGHRSPLPLLQRIPGLGSFSARRIAASNLFSALNAQGHFAVSALSYRGLELKDFRASVEVSGRVVRVDAATFRTGEGRGRGKAQVDLTSAPARVTAEVSLAEVSLQTLTPRLPGVLRKAGGSLSAAGRLETRGLTRGEMSANLQGQATLHFRNISLGDFDPLEPLARQSGAGRLEPAHGEANLRSAVMILQVRDRRIFLRNCALELSGARLELTGSYGFDASTDLSVRADLRHVRRRWLQGGDTSSNARLTDLHLAGPVDKLAVMPPIELSRANP